ncbi:hypothetical protein [Microcoleus sp. FACHB-672]|uniref:hypothetical protein n=1 Tax=Microcoleus sp. FACHB-672 TaxID=2692825 RepID=UPI00168420C1|nr:hypothetical protein [Microcoleus sp. FACHB-672]MBD2043698.1 hypothetical protein [Microcoleus sp. FACHB-672]
MAQLFLLLKFISLPGIFSLRLLCESVAGTSRQFSLFLDCRMPAVTNPQHFCL